MAEGVCAWQAALRETFSGRPLYCEVWAKRPMPVLAPLGDFAGVDRSMVITTWTAAAGWLRLIVPVNAILIAGLALAKVGFDQYVRFIAPLMGILLITILATLFVGAAR
jgi:uncharacterized ion transporter superfamily protein YfcC